MKPNINSWMAVISFVMATLSPALAEEYGGADQSNFFLSVGLFNLTLALFRGNITTVNATKPEGDL